MSAWARVGTAVRPTVQLGTNACSQLKGMQDEDIICPYTRLSKSVDGSQANFCREFAKLTLKASQMKHEDFLFIKPPTPASCLPALVALLAVERWITSPEAQASFTPLHLRSSTLHNSSAGGDPHNIRPFLGRSPPRLVVRALSNRNLATKALIDRKNEECIIFLSQDLYQAGTYHTKRLDLFAMVRIAFLFFSSILHQLGHYKLRLCGDENHWYDPCGVHGLCSHFDIEAGELVELQVFGSVVHCDLMSGRFSPFCLVDGKKDELSISYMAYALSAKTYPIGSLRFQPKMDTLSSTPDLPFSQPRPGRSVLSYLEAAIDELPESALMVSPPFRQWTNEEAEKLASLPSLDFVANVVNRPDNFLYDQQLWKSLPLGKLLNMATVLVCNQTLEASYSSPDDLALLGRLPPNSPDAVSAKRMVEHEAELALKTRLEQRWQLLMDMAKIKCDNDELPFFLKLWHVRLAPVGA